MKTKDRPIGVFDSGVGGLSVVREIMVQLPSESVLYFGDTARMPYGPKPPKEIVRYTLESMKFLEEGRAKFLLIACNTASVFLEELRGQFTVPVMGMIESGARSAVATTKNGRVGVMGTEATINSGAYPKAIEALEREIRVYSRAAPLLAPMVESGQTGDPVRVAVRDYLNPLLREGIDTLILGCTHYPLLRDIITDVVGPKVEVVDPAVECTRQLRNVLVQSDLLRCRGESPKYKFSVSANIDRFVDVSRKFLS